MNTIASKYSWTAKRHINVRKHAHIDEVKKMTSCNRNRSSTRLLYWHLSKEFQGYHHRANDTKKERKLTWICRGTAEVREKKRNQLKSYWRRNELLRRQRWWWRCSSSSTGTITARMMMMTKRKPSRYIYIYSINLGRLQIDLYDVTIALAYPIEPKTSSEKGRNREKDRQTGRQP
jgi:hypothetical protein